MKKTLLVATAIFYIATPCFANKDKHGHADSDAKASAENKNHESEHEGEEDHAHEEGSHDEAEGSHAEHDEGEGHDDHGDKEGGEHAHEEEEGSSIVGPDKGILEKSKEGFKLSPEATQTFELKFENLRSSTLEISRKSLVEIKNNKFIYRLRKGWIQKVPVKVLRKDSQKATIEISQFQEGDQIIINGVGFVRTAELVAEEGVSHGHSH